MFSLSGVQEWPSWILLSVVNEGAISLSAKVSVSSEAQVGKDPILSSRGCWQNWVPLQGIGLCSNIFFFLFLLACGQRVPSGVYHVVPSIGHCTTWQLASSKAEKEKMSLCKTTVRILHNVITSSLSLLWSHLACFYRLEEVPGLDCIQGKEVIQEYGEVGKSQE